MKKIIICFLLLNFLGSNIVFASINDLNYYQNNSDSTISLYKNNVNSMVYVETQDSSGSGVIVKPDGTFITCFHVIANADYITVKLNDGSIYNVNGFRYINPLDDIAILTLDTIRQFKPITLNQNNIEIGEKVYTISNPQGIQFTFSDGMISQFTKEYVQFTAPISSGSSGGALLNKNGQLVGMITSYWNEEGSQNINFALPNEYYQSRINNSIIKNSKKLNWTDFLVDNAGEEQFKLYTDYALNEYNFEMFYKYLKPFTNREDFPKEYYSLIGFFALYGGNYEDALHWYYLAYNYNPNHEATLFILPLLYTLNDKKNTSEFDDVLYRLNKYYPNSYNKVLELGNMSATCNGDDYCYTKIGLECFIYLNKLMGVTQ